jgi:hypothetical protein
MRRRANPHCGRIYTERVDYIERITKNGLTNINDSIERIIPIRQRWRDFYYRQKEKGKEKLVS